MAWVLIPIAAMLFAAYSEWLKFKAKQQNISASTSEIETALENMSERNANLIKRVQNLEAIVTSQTWDDMDGQSTRQQKPVVSKPILPEPELVIPTDEDEVAAIAKRIRS
ncbi:MAG: hypothetical protein E2O84_04915 [Bacteroidetes bacterium]|nr:MAG: hypothetical protein E2O84_04915 [Bacteroidota bacterium]